MTPPTPQQPTEASPSAEAMEAARKLVGRIANFIITAYQSENRNKAEAATEAAEIRIAHALDAHFAREFARRIPLPLAINSYGLSADYCDGYNAAVEDMKKLRALGGEGGKR
jgi:hypothetical protein